MLKYDERFFKLQKATFAKTDNMLHIVFTTFGNFTPQIPRHEKTVSKQILDYLEINLQIEFEYTTNALAASTGGELQDSLDQLKHYATNMPEAQKIDKTLPVKNIEYWLGVPIKIRPMQIKYLRASKELQVTAGTIHFLKRRDYKRDDMEKTLWSFVLDDRETRLQCVHFPTEKTRAKFEKLADRTSVAIIGVYDKNNRGELNFRVSGVSFCDMI
ncbi:MAG: hypothetical protein LBG88_04705 [Christensenellaceae bacterium]|jgi:hypothetical protein|nr:hypothetical protein [Christensenellaceae bacterium]